MNELSKHEAKPSSKSDSTDVQENVMIESNLNYICH